MKRQPSGNKKPIDKQYATHDSIRPWHEAPHQVKVLCGPVGSGKSLAGLMEWYFLCVESDVPVRGVVIRETHRQLKDTTLKTAMEWFPGLVWKEQDHVVQLTIPNYEGEMLTHELQMRHCRRVSDAQQFMSAELAYIWMEEVVPAFQVENGTIGAGLAPELFNLALMRQRQAGMHRLHIVLTFNPPSFGHWTYKKFFAVERKKYSDHGWELPGEDTIVVQQPPYENSGHLPVGYYEGLEERLGVELARRFVSGECVTMYPGHRVFPEASESLHFRDEIEPDRNLPLILGFDFGRTPCCLISQVARSGQLRVLCEVQSWNSGIEKFAEMLVETLEHRYPKHLKDRNWRSWCDPSIKKSEVDERTPVDVLNSEKFGFNVLGSTNDISMRLEGVRQRLNRNIDGEPAVIINRHLCPILSEALLGAYVWMETTDGIVTAKPRKGACSHVMDTCQYTCCGEFSVVDGTTKRAAPVTKEWTPTWNPLARIKEVARGGWMGS